LAVGVALVLGLGPVTVRARLLTAQEAVSSRAPSQTAADKALQTRVQAVLSNAADLRGRGIVAEVRGGVVTLTGKVATHFELQGLGAVVRAVPGVKTVRFAVQIEAPKPAAPPAPRQP
jgi:osmotically-inducible protein OsmY